MSKEPLRSSPWRLIVVAGGWLAVLCLSTRSFGSDAGGRDALEQAYSSLDWTALQRPPLDLDHKTNAAAPGSSDASPCPIPNRAAKHTLFAHTFITKKAFDLFNERYPGSELARYIGDYMPDQPPPAGQNRVIEGAYDEDIPHEDPWDDLVPELQHFWNWRGGYHAGIYGDDSSVDRAQKYFTGGYSLEGKYDRSWSRNTGIRRGVQGQGAVYLYQHGNKGLAYWYLGHAAHLLEDLTVPAHEHLWPHSQPGFDKYEEYAGANYRQWDKLPDGPIEDSASLYALFESTAKISEGYDAGFGPGPKEGMDGTIDQGKRRKDGFTTQALDEEGDALMPLAYQKVASLFRFFYKSVEPAPPQSSLKLTPEDGGVRLTALAVDSISGIDRLGYRFEYAELDPGRKSPRLRWKALNPSPRASSLLFFPKPGVFYAFRAKAENGAGNIGVSAPVYYPELGGRLIVWRDR